MNASHSSGGAIAGLWLACCACQQEPPIEVFQVSSYAEARAASARTGKPILIEFATEECPPCRAFEVAARNDRALQASLASVVLVQSMPESPGDLVALRRQVGGYPTFVLQDSLGQELDRWLGFGATAEWVERFGQALAVDRPVELVRAQFEREPTVPSALRLAQLAAAQGDRERQWHYLDRAMRLPGERPATLARERLRACVAVRDRDANCLAADAREAEAECAGDPECLLEVGWILGDNIYRWNPEPYELARQVLDRIPHFERPDLEWRRLTLESRLIFEIDRDQVRAVSGWREYLSQTEVPNALAVVAFSEWAFDDLVGYDVVLEFGTRALTAPLDRVTRAHLLDALAEAHFKSGQIQLAIATMKKAVTLEPEHVGHRATLEAWQELAQQSAEAL